MKRVAFTGLIPHHPRETHFLSAGHASHRTCSSQIVNTHRTPCVLLAQDGLKKWLRTCGCVATLGPPKKRRRAKECRRARLPKNGRWRIWVLADRRSDRAIPEEAKLPRSDDAGDRASDIYCGTVLLVNARPARPSRPVSCARKTCGFSPWPR